MPDRWGHGTDSGGLYSQDQTFGVSQRYTSEWEGGEEYYNADDDMWTAYNDKIGGNIPTLGPGLTGLVGDQNIVVGQQYPASAVDEEFQKRSQGDYDWLSTNVPTWGALNPNQQGSVMSLVHNVGQDAFQESKAFRHLGAGNYDDFMYEAFDEDVGFVKAKGSVIKGLQNRRGKERNLFSTPWEEEELAPEPQDIASSTSPRRDQFGYGTTVEEPTEGGFAEDRGFGF